MGGLIALGYVLADPPVHFPTCSCSAPARRAVPRQRAGWRRPWPRHATVRDREHVPERWARAIRRWRRRTRRPDRGALTTARLGGELFREQDRLSTVRGARRTAAREDICAHGGDDPIVPEWASRPLEGRANVTRHVYPGLHHETHNEPSGRAVIDDTVAWILSALPSFAR
jgi:alpha-beta hydrolase superfamily lysophospholipase